MASERGTAKVSQYNEFHWPVIRALKETGGSASIAEMYERVVADMKLGEEVLAVPHGDGTTSEVEYRLAWARTYLKKVGAVDNSERGVWALTSKGRAFTEKDAAQVAKQVRSQFASAANDKVRLQKWRKRRMMNRTLVGRKSCSEF
jgi:restriction system protein